MNRAYFLGIVGGRRDVPAGAGPVGVHERARIGEQLVGVGAEVILGEERANFQIRDRTKPQKATGRLPSAPGAGWRAAFRSCSRRRRPGPWRSKAWGRPTRRRSPPPSSRRTGTKGE